MAENVLVQAEPLQEFCVSVFKELDVPEEDARITAEVLVAADLRGIDSHGVARLARYVSGLRDGMMIAQPAVEVIAETAATALIDAGAGLGQPVSYRAMQKAIQKARDCGAGFVTVRNSNHYGIAGFYAMMALQHDCIGMSMTNAAVLVVPTFGRDAMLGTNPIAVAAPAGEEWPFVLDMATSTVPRGKLEVYNRLEKPIPDGWATDETGTPTDDPGQVLENFQQRAGGGLLPLGGAGELLSGHKGYGLGLWVDVFCGALSGAAYADLVYPKTPDGKPLPSNIGHFFGAWRVDGFRPVGEFKSTMDDLLKRLKAAPKAEGESRIYIHGEKEYEEEARRVEEGIPLNAKVAADLKNIAAQVGVEYNLEQSIPGPSVSLMKYKVPYGKGEIHFELPAGMRGSVAVSKPADPVENVEASVAESLSKPIGSPPVRELAGPGDTVCIVFNDVTRSSPDHVLVPALLRELEFAGVDDQDITLLCGIGLHRPSTYEEKVAKLGADVVARYRVIDNEPLNQDALVDMGITPGGVPVLVHRAAVEADLVMATGLVEPHQYAGYSGGRKTLAVGAAGEPLIAHTHGPEFIDHPGTRLGRIEGNPFHEAVTEAARRAGLRFIINVVLDDQKRVLKVAAGEPEETHRRLVEFARGVYEVEIPHRYDIVIGGVGYPKDSNVYQASRAASYLFFAPTPVVKPGGFLIVPARCEEGAGDGVGEQRFLAAMRDSPDVRSILENARQHGYPPGQQRAFVMAKVLEEATVVMVGSEQPDAISDCKMVPAETMDQALQLAANELGDQLDVLIVPHALLTLPVVKEDTA